MSACVLCGRAADGPLVADPAIGAAAHAHCFAERVPHDATVALLAALLVVLAPAVVVWAA
jgi:hypothetical protein